MHGVLRFEGFHSRELRSDDTSGLWKEIRAREIAETMRMSAHGRTVVSTTTTTDSS